jgi:hypothetical protein
VAALVLLARAAGTRIVSLSFVYDDAVATLAFLAGELLRILRVGDRAGAGETLPEPPSEGDAYVTFARTDRFTRA